MSLDPIRTLDPSVGLVSAASVYAPNEVGLWRTVGVLANGQASRPGFASAVGAFDVKRRGSITRGAGEAVERFALAPGQSDAAHLLVRAGGVDSRLDFVTAGLGRASALAYEFPWYRATNLLSRKETHVPASVVDYVPGTAEPEPWDAFFDPSPNGAASGPSEGFAQVSALAEVIERDAFLSAWRQRTPLMRFDLDVVPAGVSASEETRRFLKLLTDSKAAGVQPTLAFIPGERSPLMTAVCVITQVRGPGSFGAVGLKASPDPITALRGALQEGLQIRELFLARTPRVVPAVAVTDDESRADFWTSKAAIDELLQWTRSFSKSSWPATQRAPEVADLVEYLAGREIQSHWVNLTHRLPVAIRDMGWVAGKAVCPGAIPLTMDETKGLSLMQGGSSTPHPLI